MLVILPPSQQMSVTPVQVMEHTTEPLFQQQAEFLAGLMKNLSQHELAQELRIDEAMAEPVYEEYQHFDDEAYPKIPAIFAFKGIMYEAMNVAKYSPADLHFAQAQFRIMSLLYGILRPLDLIKPYRMCLNVKLHHLGAPDLVEYWKVLLTDQLQTEGEQTGNEILFLAGENMLKLIDEHELEQKNRLAVVTFKDWRDDKWKEIPEYIREARAALVDEIVKGKLDRIDHLLDWSWKGYKFDKEMSDQNHWVYTRSTADE